MWDLPSPVFPNIETTFTLASQSTHNFFINSSDEETCNIVVAKLFIKEYKYKTGKYIHFKNKFGLKPGAFIYWSSTERFNLILTNNLK